MVIDFFCVYLQKGLSCVSGWVFGLLHGSNFLFQQVVVTVFEEAAFLQLVRIVVEICTYMIWSYNCSLDKWESNRRYNFVYV